MVALRESVGALFCFLFANLLWVLVLRHSSAVRPLHKPTGSAHRGQKEGGSPALALSPQGEWNTYFIFFNFGETRPLSLPF